MATITTTTSETRDDAIVVAVPVVFGIIGLEADLGTLIRDVVSGMVATMTGDGMILSGTTTDVTEEIVSGLAVVAA